MAGGDNQKPKHVIVTIGKHGVLVGSVNQTREELERLVAQSNVPIEIWGAHSVGGHPISIVHIPGKEIVAKNCTGAGEFVLRCQSAAHMHLTTPLTYNPGDSLVGGTVYGLLEGHDVLHSCHLGMVAARQSLASEHAINPSLTPKVLEESF